MLLLLLWLLLAAIKQEGCSHSLSFFLPSHSYQHPCILKYSERGLILGASWLIQTTLREAPTWSNPKNSSILYEPRKATKNFTESCLWITKGEGEMVTCFLCTALSQGSYEKRRIAPQALHNLCPLAEVKMCSFCLRLKNIYFCQGKGCNPLWGRKYVNWLEHFAEQRPGSFRSWKNKGQES